MRLLVVRPDFEEVEVEVTKRWNPLKDPLRFFRGSFVRSLHQKTWGPWSVGRTTSREEEDDGGGSASCPWYCHVRPLSAEELRLSCDRAPSSA